MIFDISKTKIYYNYSKTRTDILLENIKIEKLFAILFYISNFFFNFSKNRKSLSYYKVYSECNISGGNIGGKIFTFEHGYQVYLNSKKKNILCLYLCKHLLVGQLDILE